MISRLRWQHRTWLTQPTNGRRYSTNVRMERNYAAAVAALNTLQSNFKIVTAIKKSGGRMNEQAISEVIGWCRKIGYEPSDFNQLRPVHIAGTKGKGSTSAFISSILSHYHDSDTTSNAVPLRKVGLYTSPHLRFVRERIQINNKMLSEAAFTKYFFEVWDRLEAATGSKDPSDKPIYFRFLTLMAFHTFLSEGVDTAVIECGIGGEYDTTNIITSPSVTAITSLGLDHVDILGHTLPEIAWHKTGIFKPGAKAFTVQQPEDAMKVIRQRAEERAVELTVVERHPEIENIKLGLAADFQKTNASLAIAAAASHLRSLGYTDVPDPLNVSGSPLPGRFRRGLEQVSWPGRCDVRHESAPNVAWHLDGAHTLESINVAGRWFSEQITAQAEGAQRSPRILLFNQQMRDAVSLAKALHATLSSALGKESPFTHVVFCTNVTFKDAGYRPDLVSINVNSQDVERLAVQKQLAETWKVLDPSADVEVKGTIEEAVDWCRDVAKGTDGRKQGEEAVVLVTGSIHLVGGVIEVLESRNV